MLKGNALSPSKHDLLGIHFDVGLGVDQVLFFRQGLFRSCCSCCCFYFPRRVRHRSWFLDRPIHGDWRGGGLRQRRRRGLGGEAEGGIVSGGLLGADVRPADPLLDAPLLALPLLSLRRLALRSLAYDLAAARRRQVPNKSFMKGTFETKEILIHFLTEELFELATSCSSSFGLNRAHSEAKRSWVSLLYRGNGLDRFSYKIRCIYRIKKIN